MNWQQLPKNLFKVSSTENIIDQLQISQKHEWRQEKKQLKIMVQQPLKSGC